MPRPLRQAPDLLPPPREVPPDVKLRVLAHRDVFWGAPFFFFAACALHAISPLDSDGIRWTMTLAGAGLLWMGLKVALARFRLGLRALSLMRDGLLAPARIASCRVTWSRNARQVPYEEFLPDWEDHVASSVPNVGRSMDKVFIYVFVVPFVVILFVIAAGLAWRMTSDYPLDAETTRYALFFIGSAAVTIIGFLLALRFMVIYRDKYGAKVYTIRVNLERVAREARNLSYGEIARRIEDAVLETGKPVRLKTALPKEGESIELDCRAEFAAGGEVHAAEGRVWLTNRLDPNGVEPLLYDPGRPSRVVFLKGLPTGVSIDPQGRWAGASGLPERIGLGITAAILLAAILELLWQLPWLATRIPALLR